ncbi:MAG TPA: tetratricopeptide repeat protein [Verrucomicrobiae bacterium]|jgi:predicted negative regulator of RcsB-dependent stress response
MNSDQQHRIEGEGMIAFQAWLEADNGKNKKRLGVAAILILVVAFGIYVYNYLAEQKEDKASAALIELRPPLSSADATNEPPVPASSFLKIVQEYPGTPAAERAMLLAAGAYFTDGKYSEAQAQFDRLIKEHPSSIWAADAAYGIAASLESQGKRDEALQSYNRIVTAYANSAVANEARMAMARIYEAKNQPADALKQYEEVSRSSMASMRGQEAMMARSQLLKKHPELDKPLTNAIAPMAFPPATSLTNKSAAPMTNKPASATNTAAGAPK